MISVSILGLGYIGLPTALLVSTKSEFRVTGIDINEQRLNLIQSGDLTLDENDLQEVYLSALTQKSIAFDSKLNSSDIYVVAVPTPINENNSADLSYVTDAIKNITSVLKSGQLIILESTSPIGTSSKMIEIIRTIRTDLFIDDVPDFHFTYCPERVLPGNTLFELINNDRVIGSNSKKGFSIAHSFYSSFVIGNLVSTNLETAEASKLMENSFRDLNIAFANEIMRFSMELGIDYKELIKITNLHPRVNILNPGPGVGGHCLAVDPWFLIESSKDNTQLIQAARRINDSQPYFIFNKYLQEIKDAKQILFLGISYKKNSSDLRESPALDILKMIIDLNLDNIFFYDPYIRNLPHSEASLQQYQINDFKSITPDLIIKAVDHDVFKNENFTNLINLSGGKFLELQ